ncbi:NmrA family NAD(P)-binding protein [Oceanobacillus jeddahense]|uniref:NmrA family NAD(P)-binding protein n=1 Tax=Oceanobacillus jeddahense TaxID=1462527 RepID=A0ABY5JVU3_9BACI|nr:NmrA family NAD(P)-binding protein [Oceanobacillus jeddahense]UUI04380.1 NmrA family NAD(P)-binding protein [Oceanobacillus jeddahense]
MTESILIVGGTGKVGRRVDDKLIELGKQTTIASRKIHPYFDWSDSTTWRETLKGHKQAFVTYFPDLLVEQSAQDIQLFCDMAKEVGLKHIVLLSGRRESGAEQAENILRQSGLTWNILRCSWFNQNFSENFLYDGVTAGEIVLPISDVKEPFIDVNDIAEVAVKVLADPKYENELFELTGPELLSFYDLAEKFSEKLNKEVRFTSVSLDDYHAILQKEGVPSIFVNMLMTLFQEVFDGRNEMTTNELEKMLDDQPTTFDAFITQSITQGVWQ